MRRAWSWWRVNFSLSHRDASGEQEWMDLPGCDSSELKSMFQDLRRVNHWLGGWSLTVRGISQLMDKRDPDMHFTILDVASGSADIPVMVSQWMLRQRCGASIVATDRNPEILKLTRDLGSSVSVQLVAADALQLPFADNSYDIAACSFFLHHLEPDEVMATLREMNRVARCGVVINDMVRSWPSYLGAWTFSRVFTRNRISRHDAPLSARRAYTRAELSDLAARAGLDQVACYGFFGYRVAMVIRDSGSAVQAMP